VSSCTWHGPSFSLLAVESTARVCGLSTEGMEPELPAVPWEARDPFLDDEIRTADGAWLSGYAFLHGAIVRGRVPPGVRCTYHTYQCGRPNSVTRPIRGLDVPSIISPSMRTIRNTIMVPARALLVHARCRAWVP